MRTKCCATCIYSRWHLTPTGRISKDATGLCVVELPVVPLPVCVTESYGYHEWWRGRVCQDQGDNCPLYEENKGKPLSEAEYLSQKK